MPSNRTIQRTSPAPAPSARRIPISRVRADHGLLTVDLTNRAGGCRDGGGGRDGRAKQQGADGRRRLQSGDVHRILGSCVIQAPLLRIADDDFWRRIGRTPPKVSTGVSRRQTGVFAPRLPTRLGVEISAAAVSSGRHSALSWPQIRDLIVSQGGHSLADILSLPEFEQRAIATGRRGEGPDLHASDLCGGSGLSLFRALR